MLISFIFCTLLVGCKGCYTLSGVSTQENEKTVSVQYFQNNASLAKPTYSASLTEALKDVLTSQSRLSLVSHDGDIQFEGSVTGYAVAPAAIQSGNDQAALNRLTITVTVKVTYMKRPESENFQMSYSKFADYNSSQNLSTVEDALIKTINDQLVQAIFNDALNKW